MHLKERRTIGIVGGMGPQAGVALHEAIIKFTPVKKDQDHFSVVLMTYPEALVDRTAFLEGSTPINPADGILEVIGKLVEAGAEVIGIPCNTSHAPEIFNPIQEDVYHRNQQTRLIHLPSEVICHLQKNHPESNKVGLMATNGTYKSVIYQELLSLNGYEVVVPPFDFQGQVVHKMIYDPEIGIKANSVEITDEAISLWQRALRFFKQEKAEVIILGCTELCLIHPFSAAEDIILVDTTEVLAKALIREATMPAPE